MSKVVLSRALMIRFGTINQVIREADDANRLITFMRNFKETYPRDQDPHGYETLLHRGRSKYRFLVQQAAEAQRAQGVVARQRARDAKGRFTKA